MDKQELRLEIVRIVAGANGHFKSEQVLDAAKNYERYITSSDTDKAQAPDDVVKEQQVESTVKTKKKPHKGQA
jgi:hypothetical protein